MLDIGWSEMLIILVVALIVIGPKDLPRVARNVGRWVGKARRMAREFQNQLEDMAREAELDKVKDEIEKTGRTDIKRSIEKTIDPDDEIGRALDPNDRRGSSKPASSKSAPSSRKPAQEKIEKQDAEPDTNAATPSPQVKTDRERVPAETN